MTRLLLNNDRFRALVRGDVFNTVAVDEIAIDPNLGWIRMVRAILDAVAPPDLAYLRARLAELEGANPTPPQQQKVGRDPPEAKELLGNEFTRRRS